MPRPARTSLGHAVLVVVAALTIAVLGLLTPTSASAAAPRVTDRTFGMHVYTRHESTIDAAHFPSVRVGSLRLWDSGTSWRDIERRDNRFRWGRLDQLVEVARSKRARPLVTMGQTPRFHARDRDAAGAYGPGAPSMPRLRPWKRYVRKMARRYGTRIDYQIWNEPNVIGFWTGTPEEMGRLIKSASRIIRRQAPGATVVAPGFPLRLESQRKKFERYWSVRVDGQSLGRFVDIAAVNLYPTAEGRPEDALPLLRFARRAMARAGIRKPTWTTEINYGMLGGLTAEEIPERLQAAYVVRTYVLQTTHRVRRIFWYSWRLKRIGNTILTEADNNTPTLAGRAVGVVHSWLAGTRPQGCDVRSDGMYTCTFRAADGILRVYWIPRGRTTVVVPKSATSRSFQNGRTVALVGGERLRVTKRPFMVRSGS